MLLRQTDKLKQKTLNEQLLAMCKARLNSLDRLYYIVAPFFAAPTCPATLSLLLVP